jgi:hypothetical protein
MSDGLREILQSHYDAHGSLVPIDVVAAAKSSAHPLHDRLEWDDRKAGPAYRLMQVEALIRSVRIIYREDPEPRSTRAFVAVRREPGRTSYEPAELVAADPIAREVALAEMEREWKAFQRKWSHFAEFVALVTDAVPV